jgi:DnaK suppressor protein
MNPQQAAPYQHQLQDSRAALLSQIAEQRGGVVSRADVAAEHFGRPEDSSAQLATERELEFAMGERETAELGAIDAALARIEAGTYGDCTDCGVHIPAARLHATPEAPRCIPCQEKVEQPSVPMLRQLEHHEQDLRSHPFVP